jgi:beta-galactosidase
MSGPSVGETIVCKWKNNCRAAYSVGGDDCLRSQLFFAIPEMDRRGIRGTWWVNPGRGGPQNFKNHDDEWAQCWIACYDQWVAAAARGHDFGNHTLHHLGAATLEEAEREIGQTAAAIWRANPRQRLQLFLRGGGTTWGISKEQLEGILSRYDCVQGRGGGVEDPTWEVDPDAALLRSYVDTVIEEGGWRLVGFHGIGPDCEWGGPVSGDAFTGLLDYLVERRELVWAGTHTQVHKYDQERGSATLKLLRVAKDAITLELTSSQDPRLYDCPLTLRTGVPAAWERVRISQGSSVSLVEAAAGAAQYSALPNRGEVRLQPA